MARMYPRQLEDNTQHGEKLVYAALAELPDDWVVLHSCREHYLTPNGYMHYEADFVVLVPQHGFVVIEVKDWPHVRICNGEWQGKSAAPNARWYSMGRKNSPLHQADMACNHLKSSLVLAGIFPAEEYRQPERRSLAILTDSVPEGLCEQATEHDRRICARMRGVELGSLYVCGAAALQKGLRERIEALFVRRAKLGANMDAAMLAAMEQYLAPTMRFRLDLRHYQQLFDEAAQPLVRLLSMLEESRGGMLVTGPAGSGKTLLATREAARLAARQPRDGQPHLLMLCYNHNMADALHAHPLLREQAEVLRVSNFHDYCGAQLPDALRQKPGAATKGDMLTEQALDYLQEHAGEHPSYDYIFVDEGQDFRDSWWQLIRRWLAPQGRLYVFADPGQKLYGSRGPLPDLPTRLRLRRNLRNAYDIARYCAAYRPDAAQEEPLPLQGATLMPPAPASDDPAERAAAVRELIAGIRDQSAFTVRNCDIVVLSPWKASNPRSCLPLLADLLDFAPDNESHAQMLARHQRCAKPDSPRILADTIKAFKGLEAPYVILTDICAPDESRGFNKDAFYVACTRARFGLALVPTRSGEELVHRHLRDAYESPQRLRSPEDRASEG